MAIPLNTQPPLKSVADGIFGATGSDGPGGEPEAVSLQRTRRAPRNDLVSTIQPGNFDAIEGLRREVFAEGDCDAVTEDCIQTKE